MKLQILVPQYREKDEVVAPLLRSIVTQQNVDVENEVGVIIVNDGSDVKLSDELLSSFPFEIQYIQSDHKGVSGARNTALRAATADYVMFCDCDDMFYNVCGLYLIFCEIEASHFNAYSSVFVEEGRTVDGQILYINKEMDCTFVHGKVYKRQFLIDNDIFWDESLTVHEDSYFNCLAQRVAGSFKYCKTPFYLWKWRPDSVCRGDKKYILKTYSNMIDSNDALVCQMINRGMIDDARFYVTSMIYDTYYTLNREIWVSPENSEYRLNTELRFKKYLMDYKQLFDEIAYNTKVEIILKAKKKYTNEGLLMESITFDDWIKHVMSL